MERYGGYVYNLAGPSSFSFFLSYLQHVSLFTAYIQMGSTCKQIMFLAEPSVEVLICGVVLVKKNMSVIYC